MEFCHILRHCFSVEKGKKGKGKGKKGKQKKKKGDTTEETPPAATIYPWDEDTDLDAESLPVGICNCHSYLILSCHMYCY